MTHENRTSVIFIILAAVVIVLAGVKAASVIIVPFLLSIFIAILFAPLFGWLNKKGINSSVSLIIVIITIVFIIGLLGMLIGSSIDSFSNNLPYYEKRLHEEFESVAIMLNVHEVQTLKDEFGTIFDTSRVMKVAASGLKSFGSMLTNGFVIILTVAFMLLESIHLPNKINMADSDKDVLKHLDKIISKIKKYMIIKTFVSLLTAVLVWILLISFDIDYPILWAVFAFLLNYIPNIGSLIAAVPAVLLAIIQFGFIPAIEIAIAYVIINVLIGSILEPKIMGVGLGLSTLIVFLSLIFWGWLLGPVGMLLSIPLTIMAKIVFDANENTRWIAVMLGSGEKLK